MPRNSINRNEMSYKRGLVLGLTMAEIVLLLLFSLLLALAALFWEQERALTKAFDERDIYRLELWDSQAKLETVMKQLAQSDFREMRKELVRLTEQERKIEYLMQRFAVDPDSSTEEKVSTLVEKLTKLEKVETALDVAGFSKEPETLTQELREVQDSKGTIDRIRDELNAADEKSENLEKRLNNAEQALDQKQGLVANLQRTLERYGRGTEKPACWADPETGKPRYIYDVGLTSGGLIVRHTATPPWAESRGLPIDKIPYDRELKPEEFISEARPMFEWSEENECRFFVRAYDVTAVTEKAIYKRHMRFLESSFYKYEVLDDPWRP